ncbi:cytochrome c3 family protein [Sphingomonadaceae bacterium]|nr:cytochrome c3 family protein [Sphingomonadaceae bacterium]
MAFLIQTITQRTSGDPIVREKELAQDTLTIGRAAENDLALTDLAVEQHHATIAQADGGGLAISSASTLGFTLNGKVTKSATLDPAVGGELGFGSYRLTLSQDDSGTPKITVKQVEAAEGATDALRGFALAAALPSKRIMAWAGLAAILIAFLAIPVWSHLSRERIDPGAMDVDSEGAVNMDASWSTGPLSVAHHSLEDSCESCHVDAFVSVQDETCLSCHTEVEDHAPINRQVAGMGPMSWGDDIQWSIAEAFGKEGPGTCATCHSEHEGAPRLEQVSQQFCSECHDALDSRLTDTTLANAGNFSNSHPQFQAMLWTGPDEASLTRVSLDDNPAEYSGLVFPHDLHMDRNGGVARMASNIGAKQGYGSALVCADCHTPTEDDFSFEPVNMEQDCESCHSLVMPGGGNLTHGSVQDMRSELARLDRGPRRVPVRPGRTGRTRPGAYARGGLYYQDFGAPVRNYTAVSRALQRGGVCGDCHLPTTINGRADVMPVREQTRYFVGGYFDHEAHTDESCESCHAADTSSTSSDVLMPGIAVCRDCHIGEQGGAVQAALAWPHGEARGGPGGLTSAAMSKASRGNTDEVSSSCAMCHSYHPREGVGSGNPDVPHDPDHQKAPDRIARVGRETG